MQPNDRTVGDWISVVELIIYSYIDAYIDTYNPMRGLYVCTDQSNVVLNHLHSPHDLYLLLYVPFWVHGLWFVLV